VAKRLTNKTVALPSGGDPSTTAVPKRRPPPRNGCAVSTLDAGQTIVVVEQNIAAALSLAQRVYIINNGHIVETMSKKDLRARPEVLHRYLGV